MVLQEFDFFVFEGVISKATSMDLRVVVGICKALNKRCWWIRMILSGSGTNCIFFEELRCFGKVLRVRTSDLTS